MDQPDICISSLANTMKLQKMYPSLWCHQLYHSLKIREHALLPEKNNMPNHVGAPFADDKNYRPMRTALFNKQQNEPTRVILS
jgi:hypothetical protein